MKFIFLLLLRHFYSAGVDGCEYINIISFYLPVVEVIKKEKNLIRQFFTK
jgi:hypothetical protein